MEKQLISDRINEASDLLNDMVREICREMILSGALTQDSDESSYEAKVIENVVAKHLNNLDQNFLAVVDAFEQQAKEKDVEMGKVIGKIRVEVLKQVTQRLPSEVQLLEELMEVKEKTDRVGSIRERAFRMENSNPKKVGITKLIGAAHQYIVELEESTEIVDRKLLAKLCTIREEARLVQLDEHFNRPLEVEETIELVGENVSSRAMAVVQQLMAVGISEKRTALIQKAFSEDWLGKAEDTDKKAESPDKRTTTDIVRPGSFMACLVTTQSRMDVMEEVPDAVRTRIEEIRQEAMYALRVMAWGDFSKEEIEAQDAIHAEMNGQQFDTMLGTNERKESPFVQVSETDAEVLGLFEKDG
ncbi:hypothetical protein BSKO_08964 [Bryopsis sp. KO-2023]|nr:hypothetical protein BSKO_08964 [Bryopsis sp. KO-2023]